MTFRWFLGLCIVKNRVVGRLYQLPAAPDPIVKGSVQKQAPWKAVGMKEDWDDTDLGGKFDSREDAKASVENWYVHQVRKPCSAHVRFREDCVMCKVVS